MNGHVDNAAYFRWINRVCQCGLCTWCGLPPSGVIESFDPAIFWRGCLCTPTWVDTHSTPHTCEKTPVDIPFMPVYTRGLAEACKP